MAKRPTSKLEGVVLYTYVKVLQNTHTHKKTLLDFL